MVKDEGELIGEMSQMGGLQRLPESPSVSQSKVEFEQKGLPLGNAKEACPSEHECRKKREASSFRGKT